jgi:NAD(P)-dependent dehydrogenase (short-subunit alcohol dehydrogenase family)
LVIAGVDVAEGANAQCELAARGKVRFERCDARSKGEVDRLIAAAVEQVGGLDVLYHVAGGSGRAFGDGPLHECSDAGWQKTLDLNLTSTFLTNRAAVRHFLAQRQPGVILNMASLLAIAPAPAHFDTCAYAAAKGGVIALSRQVATRYAGHGIRVNVLAPGLIDTPMSQRAVSDPAIVEYLRSKPEDLAGAAVFLCSDMARLITGLVLPIGGGWELSEGGNAESRSNHGDV